MRFRAAVAPLFCLSLSACGGGAAAPPALAFGLPDPVAVTYVTGDTSTLDIDAGGQTMQAQVASISTLAATFSKATDGVQVSLELKDLSATMSNPMATQSADESGITGPLVLNLDRRGVATVVSEPQMTDAASQYFQPLPLAHGLFPRLPGRAAAMGESWTDTIRYEGKQGPGSVSAQSVITHAVAGDTVVDGRSLVKLTMQGTTESSASGVITGMDFTQKLSATVTGWVLWDQGRKLMVESFGSSDGRGSMEVSAAPFPLAVRVRGQSRVRMQPAR